MQCWPEYASEYCVPTPELERVVSPAAALDACLEQPLRDERETRSTIKLTLFVKLRHAESFKRTYLIYNLCGFIY